MLEKWRQSLGLCLIRMYLVMKSSLKKKAYSLKHALWINKMQARFREASKFIVSWGKYLLHCRNFYVTFCGGGCVRWSFINSFL